MGIADLQRGLGYSKRLAARIRWSRPRSVLAPRAGQRWCLRTGEVTLVSFFREALAGFTWLTERRAAGCSLWRSAKLERVGKFGEGDRHGIRLLARCAGARGGTKA